MLLCPCNLDSDGSAHSGEQQLRRRWTRQSQNTRLRVLCKSSCAPRCFLLHSPWTATLLLPVGSCPAPLTCTQQESQERQGPLQPHPCLLPSLALSLPHQMGITAACCEGRRNTLVFQVLTYKKEAQDFFSQNCVWQRTEQRWGDSPFPVKPASSQERQRNT